VRSEVFSAIDDTKVRARKRDPRKDVARPKLTRSLSHSHSHSQGIPKPEPSEENEVINELIREYLKYNNYRNTLSMMISGKICGRAIFPSNASHCARA